MSHNTRTDQTRSRFGTDVLPQSHAVPEGVGRYSGTSAEEADYQEV